MRVLVYGGRKYRNKKRLHAELNKLHADTPITVIIEGGAGGADRLARYWAENRGIRPETYDADWDDLQAPVVVARKRPDGTYYNAAAGNNRNLVMMAKGRPDIAVEFPGGSGTANMRRIVREEMKRRGLRYIVIKDD